MSIRNRVILLVEDSDEDYEVIRRAFPKISHRLYRCSDGDEALDYLRRRGAYADPGTPRPAVILLDLNLPGTDGREVLDAVKADGDLCVIPVVVLSTSSDPQDIIECYRRGASGYLRKPDSLEGYRTALSQVLAYWFEASLLPL